LKTIVVWPSKGKRNPPIPPDNIILNFRDKGSWYDLDVMKFTINRIFRPHFHKMSKGKRGILILDNCRAHINQEIETIFQEMNVHIIKIPPNGTSEL